MRVAKRPEMLRRAYERAGLEALAIAARVPQYPASESGVEQPTFRQLEDFAQATHTPFGYLFLTEPSEEPVLIRDFRTVRDARFHRQVPTGWRLSIYVNTGWTGIAISHARERWSRSSLSSSVTGLLNTGVVA